MDSFYEQTYNALDSVYTYAYVSNITSKFNRLFVANYSENLIKKDIENAGVSIEYRA